MNIDIRKCTKEKIAHVIIETSPSFGWRTVKGLMKWWRKNYCEILGLNKEKANKQVRVSIKELNEYKQERIKELMRLPKSDLLTMVKQVGTRTMERRYGGDRSKMPECKLRAERQIETDKRQLSQWLRASKKKQKVVGQKPKVKVKRKKLTTMDYIKNISDFNARMSTAASVSGLEG